MERKNVRQKHIYHIDKISIEHTSVGLAPARPNYDDDDDDYLTKSIVTPYHWVMISHPRCTFGHPARITTVTSISTWPWVHDHDL